MSGYVWFHMDSGFRAQLIEKHEFYVRMAKDRLLDQFTDEAISQEADRAENESLVKRGQWFDPDRHDPADFEEAAYHDGVWRYQLMTDLHDSVRLSIVAGFFHVWEKNLRQSLYYELRHWVPEKTVKEHIWKVKLDDLFDLLESFGWPLRKASYFPNLDACRLVVNVFKHGDGPSLKALAKDYPEHMAYPLEEMRGNIGEKWFEPRHEYLKVSDKNLEDFSQSIVQFWSGVPGNVLDSQISDLPPWLVKAIENDNNRTESN